MRFTGDTDVVIDPLPFQSGELRYHVRQRKRKIYHFEAQAAKWLLVSLSFFDTNPQLILSDNRGKDGELSIILSSAVSQFLFIAAKKDKLKNNLHLDEKWLFLRGPPDFWCSGNYLVASH